MQRHGNHSSASSSTVPIEEVHMQEEEEVYQDEEPLIQEETEAKTPPADSKNGRRTERGGGGERGGGDVGGASRSPVFSWFVVLALLGVWSSVAVVYLDIVDYDRVIARAKDFHGNLSEVLQGKLKAYDTDGDGDFDMEDAKVLLDEKRKEGAERDATPPTDETAAGSNATTGLKDAATPPVGTSPEDGTETQERLAATTNQQEEDPQEAEPAEDTPSERPPVDSVSADVMMSSLLPPGAGSQDVESEIQAAVPLPPPLDEGFVPDDPQDNSFPDDLGDAIDTTGALMEEAEPVAGAEEESRGPMRGDDRSEPEPQSEAVRQVEVGPAKKKKPKLLNKLDKSIKAEIDGAEKLRKKGQLDEALRAFEALVRRYPQSPRARYGQAQTEDDLAEKRRSNELLQRAISSYRDAAELPDATPDLLRAALRRRAERQQFLGRMRGSLATLERLTQIFPEDIGLKNDLGVAHLLLGDNKGAKQVYEQVLAVVPGNGFAKVHYGFILKSENKIAESIPYLREGLESGEPGTDDGRFYFHLGDALQRVGDESAYHWYELGHQRGHFASVWQRSLYNVDGLKAQPWWTPQETGYTDLVKTLERNWRTIRDEALAVMDRRTGSFVPEEENLREKGEWGQYTLWQQGKKIGNACQGVPRTCALLERYPEATGCKRGQVKFSVMQPGTHVWPHTGPTNCRLRLHLGLVVPRPGCRIRCTNQTREWEEGRVLIFDDSFEHEVWQDANGYRLILIVDVWHPELTPYQRQTLSPI
ncbi:aspartyl/asparaginyl beta-hydroxylase-like isoform X7 [Antennarius striatus]|uniref:aspartyl/asparaginyl beta-hydroxylase-like isoform X7 n=1 Tax=Antennarius striatus TaxID=241820 RepID=UPI0035B04034